MTNPRDIQLVIRAKDEASRVVEDFTRAIEEMLRGTAQATANAKNSGSAFDEMARGALAVDKAFSLLTGRVNDATQSLADQASKIVAGEQRLADIKQQLEAAAAAAEDFRKGIVSATLDGIDAEPLRQQLGTAEAAMAALRKEAAQVERTLGKQQSTFAAAAESLDNLEARTNSLGIASQFAKREAAALADQIANEQRAAARTAAVLGQVEKATGVTRDRGNYDQLTAQLREEAARAAESEAAAVAHLKDQLNPLAKLEANLATQTARLNQWQREGRITADELTLALKRLGANAEVARRQISRGERTNNFLGLSSFELTNLTYQVNDVFTQLASGTGILQTLAQQGGQIVQIFPKVQSAIFGAFKNPYILAAGVAMTALTAAMKSASDEAERLRKVQSILEGIGDAANTNARQLSQSVRQVELLGATGEQALGLLQRFVSEGFNTKYYEEFARIAKDVSDITGQDLATSLEQVGSAFTGGYKAIAEFDDKLQFLSVTEREEIRLLFESGRASEARARAIALANAKLQETANNSRGPWKNATEALERSFDKLFDRLGETSWVEGFVGGIEDAIGSLDELLTKTKDLNLAQAQTRLEALKKYREENPLKPGDKVVTLFGENTVDQEIAAVERRIAALKKQGKAAGDTRDAESAAAEKRRRDQLREIQLNSELENSANAARRIAIRGEQEYQKALNETGDIKVAQARRDAEIVRARKEEARRAEQARRQRNADFAKQIDNQGRANLLTTASGFTDRSENRASDRTVLTDFFKAANVNIDPKMVEWCAAFVNAVLATNGLPTVNQATGGSDLRARDFLSYGSKVAEPEPGDIVILKRGGAGGHVGFFKGFTGAGDVQVLGGNQGNGVNVSTFRKQDVLGFRRAPSQADVAEKQAAEDLKRAKDQQEYNRDIDVEIAKRKEATAALREQQRLSGETLIDAQREQAVREALAEATAKAGKNELVLNDERRKAIADSVREEFNLQHARERATAARGERDALLERLDLLKRIGDPTSIAQTEAAIGKLDGAVRLALENLVAYLKTLGDNPEIRAAIQQAENALVKLDLDARDRRANSLQDQVQQYQAISNGIRQQIDQAQNLGQTGVVEQLREQLKGVDQDFLTAIDAAIAFWKTHSGPEAQAALLNLENMRGQLIATQNEFIITAGQIQDAFAGSLSDGIKAFAQRLVDTRDVLGSLAQGALTFAQEFLQQLAEMGLKMLALKTAQKLGFGGLADGFNSALGLGQGAALTGAATGLTAAGGALTAAGGTLTTAAAAWAATAAAIEAAATTLLAANSIGGAGLFHTGGIVGVGSASRQAPMALFAGATRYHSGGIAGLQPNEVPIIAQRGEEILTRTDPRHRANQGAGGGNHRPLHLSQVLAIGEKEITAAMRNAGGQEVIVTTIRRNKETIRSILRD